MKPSIFKLCREYNELSVNRKAKNLPLYQLEGLSKSFDDFPPYYSLIDVPLMHMLYLQRLNPNLEFLLNKKFSISLFEYKSNLIRDKSEKFKIKNGLELIFENEWNSKQKAGETIIDLIPDQTSLTSGLLTGYFINTFAPELNTFLAIGGIFTAVVLGIPVGIGVAKTLNNIRGTTNSDIKETMAQGEEITKYLNSTLHKFGNFEAPHCQDIINMINYAKRYMTTNLGLPLPSPEDGSTLYLQGIVLPSLARNFKAMPFLERKKYTSQFREDLKTLGIAI